MRTSTFSQSIYPRKILISNDTCIAISSSQLRVIVKDLNDYKYLQKKYSLVSKDILYADSISSLLKNISDKKDSIIQCKDSELNTIRRYYSEVVSLEEKRIKDIRVQHRKTTIGVGVGGVLCGLLIGVLFIR